MWSSFFEWIPDFFWWFYIVICIILNFIHEKNPTSDCPEQGAWRGGDPGGAARYGGRDGVQWWQFRVERPRERAPALYRGPEVRVCIALEFVREVFPLEIAITVRRRDLRKVQPGRDLLFFRRAPGAVGGQDPKKGSAERKYTTPELRPWALWAPPCVPSRPRQHALLHNLAAEDRCGAVEIHRVLSGGSSHQI